MQNVQHNLDRPLDLKHYFRMFWRRRALILLCAVTLLCTTVIGLEFVPPGYQSSATIAIEERQRLSAELEKLMGGMRQPSSGYRVDEERLAGIVSRVQSRPFLERVVRLLRMHEDPLVVEQAKLALLKRTDTTLEEEATRIVVGQLRGKITVEPAASGVYKFTVTDSDPRNAQLLARWISELFVDISAQNSLDELRRAHEFGAEQLKIYEDQLQRSEAALETYKETQIEQRLAQRIVSDRNATVAETLHKRIRDEVDLSRVRILPFERTLSSAGLSRVPDDILANAEIRSEGRGLAAALEDVLTERLLDERPNVGDWPPGGDYVTLRRTLFQTIERHVQENYSDHAPEQRDAMARHVFSTLDHRAHQAAADYLGAAINGFKVQEQSGPRGELELRRLEAEVSSNRELLSLFRAQLIAADVSQAVETTNLGPRIEILDPPQVPAAPASPNRMLILAAALGMGPLLGLGLAMAVELLDSTLHGLHDFERIFRGPILGTTPLVSRITQPVHPLRRYWIQASLIGVLLMTLAFFVTRATVMPNLGADADTVHAIDPEQAVAP